MDIDSIPIGVNFRDYIADALRNTDIMLVIIGPKWLGDHKRRTRIQNPTDPVRIELEKAFELGILVWPVLVDAAVMPDPAKLPESLSILSDRNAATVNAGRDFHAHMDRLIRQMSARLSTSQNNQVGNTSPLKFVNSDSSHHAQRNDSNVESKAQKPLPRGKWLIASLTFGTLAIVGVGWAIATGIHKSDTAAISADNSTAASTQPAVTAAAAVSCNQEKSLRSLGTNMPTSITFTNKTNAVIRIHWLNFSGERVLYGTLTGGQVLNQQTYITHPWVVANSLDQCVAIYMPMPNPQYVNIN